MKFRDAKIDTFIELAGSDAKAPRTANAPAEAVRVAAAKARAMQKCRENNPVGGRFGMQYSESHYKDYAGPETSQWAAGHTAFLAQLIGTVCNGCPVPHGARHHYNAATGKFDELGFTIQQLRAAFQGRIKELGLSEALLEEWNIAPRDWREDQAFYDLPFDQRMKTFKEAA